MEMLCTEPFGMKSHVGQVTSTLVLDAFLIPGSDHLNAELWSQPGSKLGQTICGLLLEQVPCIAYLLTTRSPLFAIWYCLQCLSRLLHT